MSHREPNGLPLNVSKSHIGLWDCEIAEFPKSHSTCRNPTTCRYFVYVKKKILMTYTLNQIALKCLLGTFSFPQDTSVPFGLVCISLKKSSWSKQNIRTFWNSNILCAVLGIFSILHFHNPQRDSDMFTENLPGSLCDVYMSCCSYCILSHES